MTNDKLEIATEIAWSFLGRPYIWGGDDPMAGFDCSGFVIEILKSVGLLPPGGDWTAEMLCDRFQDFSVPDPYEGCLVFWTNERDRIIHVEYCLDDELSIGASGGTSATVSERDAISQNAYIKIRPFRNRDPAGFVDPFETSRQIL